MKECSDPLLSYAYQIERDVQGKGVDVILDCIGAPYLEKDLDCLAVDGCIVYIGFMGGARSPS